ncbi:hypothetical protein LZZ85_20660 [Terrimonas sp. NA20]|uniref:DUF2004 domain-containing protein n=1 Tax=Terrimonas ginsenosidimutans TaxID=2908004 RepID=A0ABS9KWQ9_9BACT|nr:hypothetical protein [Terrimonas ginsenosidimutans]MCG2616723.1 hypothetical protein [Terrimonas ginsenosidimutans]
MGLFDLFKKPKKIEDEFFGTLTLIKPGDPSKAFLSGAGYFAPAEKEIEHLIEASEQGPSQSQRDFYLDLQRNYDQYLLKIIPRLEEEFRKYEENFSIKNFREEFSLDSLTVPRITRETPDWEISFTTIHDGHVFTIQMTGDAPGDITLDG